MKGKIATALGALVFLDAALTIVIGIPKLRAQTAVEAPWMKDPGNFTNVRTVTAGNLLVPTSAISTGQGLTTTGGTITNGNLTLSHATFVAGSVIIGSALPEGAIYHQVVDRYFDKDGKPLETSSATHVIDLDCHGGRRQQDLIATIHDDQHGNVWFGEQVAAADVASAAAAQ